MNKDKALKYGAAFFGGVIFGSAGFKALGSREAKSAYVGATAAGLRIKSFVMSSAERVQAAADDVVAEAKALNEKRDAEEACGCSCKADGSCEDGSGTEEKSECNDKEK